MKRVLYLLGVLFASCSEETGRVAGDGRADPDGQTLWDGPLPHDGPRASDGVALKDVKPVADGPTADGPKKFDGPASDAAGSCPTQALTPGTHTLSLQHGGLQRKFIAYVPKGYTNTVHLPLVLNFHGLGSNAAQQAQNSSMNARADVQSFIVAYPEGYQNSWNAGMCCGQASSTNVDDVGFVRAVVANLEQKVCVDSKRVYATGMSNGGLMSYRLACEAADLFAAIAPVSGMLVLASCKPSRPVPVMAFHGTLDSLVPYNSATSTISGWVSRDGCAAAPVQTYSKGMVTCQTYNPCTAGVEVVLCTVTGGGHCWPGNPVCLFGAPTTDISATDAMWTFFDRFSLP